MRPRSLGVALCVAAVCSLSASVTHAQPEAQDDEAEADAAAATAEEAELEEETPLAPPSKGKAVVWGVVTDSKFREGMIEASVQVLGRREKVLTDVDGRFRLELPPGTYSLRASYELHRPARVDSVVLREGEQMRVDLSLVPDDTAIEEVLIEDSVDQTSVEGQALERKRSAAVGDGVGRAEIARTPDRNAAEAAQRVVGATIVGGRFVYVRGLGERYTNALLNGTPLPSPEPDRQTVPLDLFPSLVLDSLTIVKQFTPDVPGDFAGGSVRINTRQLPRQTLFQVSLSGAYDSQSTFDERLRYRGGGLDWLGLPGENRRLPAGLPNQKLDTSSSDEMRQFWGRRLTSYMSTYRQRSLPNYGLSVVAGDSVKLGESGKAGIITALTYGRSFLSRSIEVKNYNPEVAPDGTKGPRKTDDLSGEQGTDTVRWGMFANASLELYKDHQLSLTGLRSHSSENGATALEGIFEGSGARAHSTHLEFVTRALNFGQLRGEHRFPQLNGTEVDWHLALSSATREQPDTRDTQYDRSPQADVFSWRPGGLSGSHFFSVQTETSRGLGLDLSQPIVEEGGFATRLKFGGLLNTREREFEARRFVFERSTSPNPGFASVASCEGGEFFASCPDQLFTVGNVTPDGLVLREATQRNDQYSASQNIYAGYGMLDMQPVKILRLVGGARVESTASSISAWDPFDRESTELDSRLESTNVLPAASVVLQTSEKTNLRFGVSRTLARPQLREITPFLSNSFAAELSTQGEPSLRITRITNWDVRFEVFPTLREVLAASIFYKNFRHPIEEVIKPGGISTFANAEGAKLIGAELEARKSLGFLNQALEPFLVIANLTLAQSTIDLGKEKGSATNTERPMAYQSPYVVNLALDYANQTSRTDARVLYNVYGARLNAVGQQGLPDSYEMPRHMIDVTLAQKLAKHWEVKLGVQNLLGSDLIYALRGVQEVRIETRADGARVFTRGVRDPVRRRYSAGSIYALSATFTY